METKDILYSMIYNEFRKNIINTSYINMSNEEYTELLLNKENSKVSKEFLDFCLLRNYLRETKPVNTYDEIIDIVNINDSYLEAKYNKVFSNNHLKEKLKTEINNKILKHDDNYSYFDSRYVYGLNKYRSNLNDIKFIIDINLDSNVEETAIRFILKCADNNIPYLFKLSNDNHIIIESDKENIDNYKNILFEIIDNEDLIDFNVNNIEKEEPKSEKFNFVKTKFRKILKNKRNY